MANKWVSDGKGGYRSESVGQTSDNLVENGYSPEMSRFISSDHDAVYHRKPGEKVTKSQPITLPLPTDTDDLPENRDLGNEHSTKFLR